MSPPVRNGSICSSSSRAPVQHADAGRPERLVPGPAVEVGAERAHVDRHLRHRLRAVDERHRAGRARARGHLGDRVDRAEHVGDVREGDQLDVAARELARRAACSESSPRSSTSR